MLSEKTLANIKSPRVLEWVKEGYAEEEKLNRIEARILESSPLLKKYDLACNAYTNDKYDPTLFEQLDKDHKITREILTDQEYEELLSLVELVKQGLVMGSTMRCWSGADKIHIDIYRLLSVANGSNYRPRLEYINHCLNHHYYD